MSKITTIQVWGDPQPVIELGNQHWLSWLVESLRPDEPDRRGWFKSVAVLEEGQVPFGAHEYHMWDGEICYGYVSWTEFHGMKLSGHTLESLDPVTISPSLQCRACPSHGFIRDGKWVNAG